MERPTARSLTLDLLSTLRGGSMPIAALVAAAELFGVASGSLRVAVTRLLGAGQIERDGRGRYRLGPAAQAVDRHAGSWRRADARLRRWDGRWIGVQTSALGADLVSDRALAWLGFERLRPGLAIRPDNWKGGAEPVREELIALGLAADCVVFRLDSFHVTDEAAARALWDTASLERGYRRALADLARSRQSLPERSEGEAMVESFLLGGRIIRELARDPLLPEALVPGGGRRAVIAAMRAYDQAGRRAWSAFMARHGAPHIENPSHGRSVAAPSPVPAAATAMPA